MKSTQAFTLGKINLILIAVSFLIIVTGFFLMTGSTTEVEFNPDVFSFRRITLAPMVSLFGFVLMVFAILYKSKNKNK